MSTRFQPVFERLRDVLREHEAGFAVSHDTPTRYRLEAPVGPATLRAWGGKVRTAKIPVAWVELGRSYVGYHLIGIQGNAPLLASLSKPMKARMHGKTCFNFTAIDEALLREIEEVTARALDGLRESGFIAA